MKPKNFIPLLTLSLALTACDEMTAQGEQKANVHILPATTCDFDGGPVRKGYHHRWCVGTPDIGNTCNGQFYCKDCKETGWTAPYKC